MTDRYNALTVVLTHDIRSDDAEMILNAIRMIRGVLSVETHVADPGSFVSEMRVRNELSQKLLAALR